MIMDLLLPWRWQDRIDAVFGVAVYAVLVLAFVGLPILFVADQNYRASHHCPRGMVLTSARDAGYICVVLPR